MADLRFVGPNNNGQASVVWTVIRQVLDDDGAASASTAPILNCVAARAVGRCRSQQSTAIKPRLAVA